MAGESTEGKRLKEQDEALWQKNSECVWTETDEGLWETSCGQLHEFMSGGPKDNMQNYCGYCGKLLVEVLYEPEEVE